MAINWRLCLLLIGCIVYEIHAAALQTTETNNDENDQNDDETTTTTTTTHKPLENEHIDVNNSKVVIDLYTPNQTFNSDEIQQNDTTTTAKNVTPFVQVVIKQSDTEIVSDVTSDIQINDNVTESTSPTLETDPLQLIPPASVNASIKQIEKESKQKQGQIIIRYAF